MPLRLLLNLGALFLLAIILTITFITYQHSNNTLKHVSTMLEKQSDTQEKLSKINNYLIKADHKLDMFFHQSRINKDEIISSLEQLLILSNKIDKLTISEQDKLINKVIKLRESTQEYFDAPVSESSTKTENRGAYDFESVLIDLKQDLADIYHNIYTTKNRAVLLNIIKTTSNLATSIQIRLTAYIEQDIVRVEDIIKPLETTQLIIQQINGQLWFGSHMASPSHQFSSQQNQLLSKLSKSIYRLSASIKHYSQEEKKVDPSADQLINLRQFIDSLRSNVNSLLNEENKLIHDHIAEEQESFSSVTNSNQQLFLLFTGAGVLLAVLGLIWSRYIINKSVEKLVDGVKQFSSGDLDYRIQAIPMDEFDKIATEFNQMAVTLKNQEKDLQKNLLLLDSANQEITIANQILEQKVENRTQKLQHVMELTKNANQDNNK